MTMKSALHAKASSNILLSSLSDNKSKLIVGLTCRDFGSTQMFLDYSSACNENAYF